MKNTYSQEMDNIYKTAPRSSTELQSRNTKTKNDLRQTIIKQAGCISYMDPQRLAFAKSYDTSPGNRNSYKTKHYTDMEPANQAPQ